MTETLENERDWRLHWNAVGEWAGPRDLMKQVKRTVRGQPMGEGQIALSADAARAALDLGASDILLDLACGNGLVTLRLARVCWAVYGVDYSSELIAVARRHCSAPNITYIVGDAADISAAQLDHERPTKVAMIAGLQYFTAAKLERLLTAIRSLTGGTAPVFFTDVPDVEHLYTFYDTPERRAYYEQQQAMRTEPMGTWWSRRHLARLLGSAGYTAEFKSQAPDRYPTCHYRFDLLARPPR